MSLPVPRHTTKSTKEEHKRHRPEQLYERTFSRLCLLCLPLCFLWCVSSYIENDEPQPQVLLALGFEMLNPRWFRSSWKSTVTPSRHMRRRVSLTTSTAWNSERSSSFSVKVGSRSSLCWKPEQPPPTTRRRR